MTKKCIISNSYDLKDAIMLMRYRNRMPLDSQLSYCSYDRIGRFLNISRETVRRVCLKHFSLLKASKSPLLKRSKRTIKTLACRSQCFGRLTEEHIGELCDQRTLQEQAGKSLEERAALFNAAHTEVRISKNKLYQIYRRQGIRLKQIKMTKLLN